MTAKTEAPCGLWPSPISASDVAQASLRLNDVCVDGDDIYWVEGRPGEGGRAVVVRWYDGQTEDVIPAPYSSQTAVHEYGGGAMTVRDGVVYFSNAADARIYVVEGHGAAPRALTADGIGLRFADFAVDATRKRLIAVAEDHSGADVVNSIVAISLADGAVFPLVSGADFYAAPRLSHDGAQLAWIAWDFPNMPWDTTQLWRSSVETNGSLSSIRQVEIGDAESVAQPAWSPSNVLHCVSDRTGFWNVYAVDDTALRAVAAIDAECARPQWLFGLTSYTLADDGDIWVCGARAGSWQLFHAVDGAVSALDLPYTELGAHVKWFGGKLLLASGGPRTVSGLHLVDPATSAIATLWRAATQSLGDEWISVARPVEFPALDGSTAYAFLYSPCNPHATAPEGTLPPLLVRCHGGPTSAVATSFSLETQFWTTRGFAVCDVNYGGSTGYGRAYRERLRGQMGCVDVDDCVAAAQYLAKNGYVDPNRLAITGGSAGGYIALAALVFAPDVFNAATSYYGVTDLAMLAKDTHKFESRYLDSLIGPFDTHSSLYHNRSPINLASRLQTPLLVLQGLDDAVVPPSQAEVLVRALEENGVYHEYITFEGERHGFRIGANIVRALEAEYDFYCKALHLAEGVPA